MKKALISTIEPRETGYRVAEVALEEFEVAPAFIWVDCQDDIVADMYWYNPADGTFNLFPEEPSTLVKQPTSTGSQTF